MARIAALQAENRQLTEHVVKLEKSWCWRGFIVCAEKRKAHRSAL